MDADAFALQGRFVTEVGVRQAWPFLTFCDNGTAPANEVRLYIDTTFRIDAGPVAFGDGDPEPAAAALLDLIDRAVTDVQLATTNELIMTFDGGERVLVVAGESAHFTTGDIWWLGKP